MKKLFILVASMFLFLSVSHAEDVVITTGGKGLTYNGVYGPNLASALQEYGNSVTVNTSKGSLDNLDKVASGQAQIGFTQADAYMFWRTNHPNEAQNIDIIGELGQECVFVAVRDDDKIDDAGDLKKGVKIAVGEPTSGSFASWSYLQTLIPDYAKATTFNKGGDRSLTKVMTGEYDAFLWVSAKDKQNKFLTAVMMKGSGLKLINMSTWSVNDKLPNGQRVYTKETSITKDNTFSDDTVDVPCTKTLVIGNVNASDELLDSVAGIMLKNRSRVLGEADK